MWGLKRGENKEPSKEDDRITERRGAGRSALRARGVALAGSRGHNAFPHAEQFREIEDAGSLSTLGRCSRSLQWINSATALERFREEVLAEVEGWDQPSRRYVLDLGCTRPNLRADDRSESGHAGQRTCQPVDRAFARRSSARPTTPCAAQRNRYDYLDFIV